MIKKILFTFSLFTILIMLCIVSVGCNKIKVPDFERYPAPCAVIDLQTNKVYQGKKELSAWADKHEKQMSKQNKISTTLIGIDAIDWLAKHDYIIQKIEVFIDGVPTNKHGTSILTPSKKSIITSELIPPGKVVFGTDDKGIVDECVLNCYVLIHTDDCIIQMNAFGYDDIGVTFYVEQR